ncbi:MAG TPA: DUF3570 domain-containing protein [Burkholderiaceae bacterium]|nr:DUF3570 domain-containing protein [Burkholderiaceae bacterium]
MAATEPGANADANAETCAARAPRHVPTLVLLAAGTLVATPACADNYFGYQASRYVEAGQRIHVFSGDLSVEKDFGTDYTLHADMIYDGISGATPSWVAKPGYANEFQAGLQKVDDEVRNALSTTLAVRDAARNEYTFGLAYSHESDFISREISAQAQLWSDDSHDRSYTIGASIQDNTSLATGFTNNTANAGAHAVALQAGVNQVVDARTTLEASVFYAGDSGFLSNQYLKIVRTDAVGEHYLAPDDRPDSRRGGGVAVRWIHSWSDALQSNLWVRWYRDDWGITSGTAEAKAYWSIDDHWRLGPVLRVYHQSSADFYRAYGGNPNTFASTGYGTDDARLGTLTAVTTQLNAEYRADANWTLNAGVSRYSNNAGLRAGWLTAGFIYRY